MRKPDLEVREVVCSETGKPISKIPAWMAEVEVKFVSDEARQKHPAPPSLADLEPPTRRSSIASTGIEKIKDLDEAVATIEDEDEFEDVELEVDDAEEIEDDLEA